MLVAGDIIRPNDIAGVMRRANRLEASAMTVFISSDRVTEPPDGNEVRQYTPTGTQIGSGFGAGQGIGLAVDKQGVNVVSVRNSTALASISSRKVAGLHAANWNIFDLNQPQGIGIDRFGRSYVSIAGDGVMHRYSSSGVFQFQFGAAGRGVSVKSAIVLVTGADKIVQYNTSGAFGGEFGSSGTGNGEFDRPVDCAMDSQRRIYVVDRGNARVQRFSSGGGYQTQWGSSGANPGEFQTISGIDVSPSNRVYVVDKFRCQVFDADGTFILQFDHFDDSFNPLVALAVGGQTTFFRYPTILLSEKVSAGIPDAGASVPSDSFFEENLIRPNEIVDVRNAVEAVTVQYKNAVTGGAFNWTNGSPNNLYHVAVENGEYDWDRPLKIDLSREEIRIDELNEIDACLSKLEGSELFA